MIKCVVAIKKEEKTSRNIIFRDTHTCHNVAKLKLNYNESWIRIWPWYVYFILSYLFLIFRNPPMTCFFSNYFFVFVLYMRLHCSKLPSFWDLVSKFWDFTCTLLFSLTFNHGLILDFCPIFVSKLSTYVITQVCYYNFKKF